MNYLASLKYTIDRLPLGFIYKDFKNRTELKQGKFRFKNTHPEFTIPKTSLPNRELQKNKSKIDIEEIAPINKNTPTQLQTIKKLANLFIKIGLVDIPQGRLTEEDILKLDRDILFYLAYLDENSESKSCLSSFRFIYSNLQYLVSQINLISDKEKLKLLPLLFTKIFKKLGPVEKLTIRLPQNIQRSKLYKIPNSLTNLNNLKFLEIRVLVFDQFPKLIGSLLALETLIFRDNISNRHIRRLPLAICKLTNLKKLVFTEIYFQNMRARTVLDEIPDEIANLKKLEALELDLTLKPKISNNLKQLNCMKEALIKIAKTYVDQNNKPLTFEKRLNLSIHCKKKRYRRYAPMNTIALSDTIKNGDHFYETLLRESKSWDPEGAWKIKCTN